MVGSWLWELLLMMISSSNNKHDLTHALVVAISLLIIFTTLLFYKLSLSTSNYGSAAAPPLPPGPLSLPILGYLPFLSRDLHIQMTTMGQTYGPIFKFYVGSKLHVIINTPELAKVVLRDQDDTFANRQLTIASSIITYGGQDILFSKNTSNWRSLRKVLVYEVLNNKNLEACASFRREEVRKTINEVFSRISSAVNISEVAFMTSSKVVTKMVWENSSGKGAKDSDVGAELQLAATKCVDIFRRLNLSDIFPFLAIFDLQGVERDIKMQHKKLDQIFESMIEERVRYNSKESQDGGSGNEGKKDFLQTLLELMKVRKDATSLNIAQIKSLLLDIMIGGTDTVTTLIEWVMAEIIQHDKVMKKVHEELEDIVGLNNIVEESHLPKLEYLYATIMETMRLHTISTLLVPRSPTQDCIVGGYAVPKGTTVFVNAWSIHRDPRYWSNPLDFNPERFLTNKFDLKGNVSLKFLPFGSGRRVCPGIPLAEKMHIYILASLLHSFNWRLPEGEKHDLSETFGVVLKKTKPLIVIPSQRLPDVSLYM